jgi:nucleotide-binding universal stress UspA family protein
MSGRRRGKPASSIRAFADVGAADLEEVTIEEVTEMSKPQIVVGVDGSPDSKDALLWAAEHARLMGGTLRVVYAWSLGGIAGLGIPPLPGYGLLEERAKEFPAQLAREVLGEERDITVVPVAVRGNAAQVLVDASAKADLLVIGSRGLGGLKDMVLGSVGHHCAAHSNCPVVLFHEPHAHRRRRVRRQGVPARTRAGVGGAQTD